MVLISTKKELQMKWLKGRNYSDEHIHQLIKGQSSTNKKRKRILEIIEWDQYGKLISFENLESRY